MSVWDVGDQARVGNYSGSSTDPFKNLAGTPTNPTTVALKIRKASGVLLEYGWPTAGPNGVLQNESAGRFYVDISYDNVPGVWKFRLEGVGAVAAAHEWTETVKRSLVL